jgi:hypothetical protein
MNIEHWNWAVWVLVILNIGGTCYRIGRHGKPIGGDYNAGGAIFCLLLIGTLYYFAGFLK